MATMAEAIRRLRIQQVYETPGGPAAIRTTREFAAAQREAAQASATMGKATNETETFLQRQVRQLQESSRQARQYFREMQLGAQTREGLRGTASDYGQFYGGAVQYGAQATAAGIRAVTPAIGILGREAATVSGIFAREMAPAFGMVAKEAMATAAVVGKDLAPAFGALGRQLLPLAVAGGPLLLFAAGVLYTANTAAGAITAYRKYEDRLVELNNVLALTGVAAGKTLADVQRLADSIGNINETREAAQALLGFRSVAGDTFDRAMRAANDLSASGFGSVTAAAKAMGQALTDPAQGLGALEAAGLRFSTVQKRVWQDMIETGRAAEAQNQILAAVAGQVGGAGAARAGSLSGAWTALSDAMQRGSEQWGESIANALRLADAVNTLAKAMNWLNGLLPPGGAVDPDVVQQYQKYAIRRAGGTPGAVFGNRLEDIKVAPTIGADEAYSVFGPIWDRNRAQQDRTAGVVDALERERRALQQTNVEREIEKRQREAGVAASSAEGQRIAAEVRQNEALKTAIEAQAEARKRATEQARRDAEFERRAAEQRQTTIEKLLQERDALFMSAEAARAAALAQAELAKYRERGVAVSDSLRGDIEAWARQVAEIERVNRSIGELKSAMTDFAVGFARDLRNGVSATEALGNALDRLVDKLMDKALTQAVDSLFGALGGGTGGGLLSGITKLLGSADGNVFAGGTVVPFARGGVIDRPVVFPLARGMGLAGEAGPEAVMPLQRAPDGRLGVVAQGASPKNDASPSPIVLTFNVTTPDAASFRRAQSQITADLASALRRAERNL